VESSAGNSPQKKIRIAQARADANSISDSQAEDFDRQSADQRSTPTKIFFSVGVFAVEDKNASNEKIAAIRLRSLLRRFRGDFVLSLTDCRRRNALVRPNPNLNLLFLTGPSTDRPLLKKAPSWDLSVIR